MKRLFLALGVIFLPVLPSARAASELDSIPLARTLQFDPTQQQGRGFAAFTSSIGLATFGNFFRPSMAEIRKDIHEKISHPGLQKYFPSTKERSALADRIARNVESRLSRGLSNAVVIEAIDYAAVDLVSTIVDRAMEKEGIRDGRRRKLWSAKLLQIFRSCTAQSKTYDEAKVCLTVLQSDLVRNIGLAITHEMARQELGPAYAAARPKQYIKCLQLEKADSESRVRPCVVDGMRSAAFEFGKAKTLAAAKEQVPDVANAIVEKTLPSFQKCLKTASDKDGFARCADSLTVQAGGEIAKETLLQTSQLKAYFPKPQDLEKIASTGAATFRNCAEENRQKNLREESGTIRVDNCALRVRSETAKTVVLSLFEKNLEEAMPKFPKERQAIYKNAKARLENCWSAEASDDKNNPCARQSLIQIVKEVANARLTRELPASLSTKEPTLLDSLVKNTGTCLEKELPEKLLQSSDTSKKVNVCASRLLREAALKLAEHELYSVLHGRKTGSETTDKIAARLLKKEFATCLGELPDSAKVDKCGLELKRIASVEIAEALFQGEFDAFVSERGGMKVYGLTKDLKDAFMEKLIDQHTNCIQKNLRADNYSKSSTLMNACFKDSIHTFAVYLGGLEFERATKNYLGNQLDALKSYSTQFSKDFGLCLHEKKPSAFALSEYLENITTCQTRLTKVYTERIGKHQLQMASLDALPGEENEAKRQSLLLPLENEFSNCLRNTKDGKLEECVTKLDSEATFTLVTAAANDRAKKLLNAPSPPKAFAQLENEFKTCSLKDRKNTDQCSVEYVRKVAKEVGSTKLRHTLADVLGAATYNEAKEKMAELESMFQDCLGKISGKRITKDFTNGIDWCTKRLEEESINYLQARLQDWLYKPNAPETEDSLLQKVALTVPCFDTLLPAKPFREEALEAIDPEGVLQVLAKVTGDYINYDVDKATGDFYDILKQVMKDLEAAGPLQARKNLLSLLIDRGMVDQLLKSFILSEIKDSITKLPDPEKLGPELSQALTSKETLEKALTPEFLEKVRPLLSEKILNPVLVEGKPFTAPEQQAALELLKAEVVEELLRSPHFGDELVSKTAQKEIDASAGNAATKWLGGLFGGYKTYTWNEVRENKEGQEAERYIREEIIRPMLSANPPSNEVLAERKIKASALVKEALKTCPKTTTCK